MPSRSWPAVTWTRTYTRYAERGRDRAADRAHSSVVEHSPYKRGVRRFKSYCAHFFEYLLVCLGRNRGFEQVIDISYLCGAKAVWCVDAASENHVCSHRGPRWGLHVSREHGESQRVQPPSRAP